MSPAGASDPAGELRESLRQFAIIQAPGFEHPQCLFPARYEILRRSFKLAEPVPCPFDQWYGEFKPEKISYAYASQFVSNPTSVFGHSFFLVSSNSVNEYLWSTFNYTADIPKEATGLSYVMNGIFGGFQGAFEVVPFHQRLQIYNDFENRDLWIYDLKLSKDEQRLLLKHMWELANRAQLRYYFFDENCAGLLLSTLEVVKPDFDGHSRFSIFIPPGEVPKVLMEFGLVEDFRQKPALDKILFARLKSLNTAERADFDESLRNRSLTATAQQNAAVLEALMDYLGFLFTKNKGTLTPTFVTFRKQVYEARAHLGVSASPHKLVVSEEPPHLSHGIRKISFGAVQIGSTQSFDLSYRLLIHGLMDLPTGYLHNSEIELLDTHLNFESNRGLRLERVTFAGMTNFQPMNALETPLSWTFRTSLERNLFFNEFDRYYFEATGGMGLSVALQDSPLLGYALGAVRFTNGARGPLSPLEAGPTVGFLYDHGPWRWRSSVGYYLSADAAADHPEVITLNDLRWNLNAKAAVDLSQSTYRITDIQQEIEEYKLIFSCFY